MRSTTRRAPEARRRPARRTTRWIAAGTRARRAALLLGLAALLAACSGDQSALDPQGPYAQDPHNLFVIVMWIALAVFILVQGLIIYTAIRFRARDDDELPVQTHGNTRLEIMWTVIPALILAGIAVPTIQQIFDLDEEPEGALIVEVIGHRWWWEYRYPDSGIITANELVIPEDRPIRLEMRAEEEGQPDRGVLHSYWVPALGGKQDVVPGRVVTLNLQADEPGRYLGMCTEYCGLSHANMRNRAVVMTQADYDQWVADQQQGAAVPEGDEAAMRGLDLFEANCATCHQVRTDGVSSAEDFVDSTGPNLTHLMSRDEIAGAVLDLKLRDEDGAFTDEVNVEQLEAWLRNPPAEKAMTPEDGIGMPNLNLTEDEIDDLVAYLTTLE